MMLSEEIAALVGVPAGRAYERILLAKEELAELTVFNYPAPPLLQTRVQQSQFEEGIIGSALELRASSGMPFWEAIFECCLREGRCSDALLDGAAFHSGLGVPRRYTREDLEHGVLEKLSRGPEKNIGLGSEVVLTDGSKLYFHQFDFRCAVSPENAAIVEAISRRLMPDGFVVVDSGDSYHALSIDPVSASERVHALGKALLFSPIIDCRYIGHQLRQHCSSLRISRGGTAERIPRVVTGLGLD
jgi:hypothetical protein